MGLLTKVEKFLDGKKSYIIAILAGALTIWQGLGHVVPESIWTGMAALGLAAVRSAVGNGTGASK